MKKITAEIKINYIFDTTHKGSNYSFDGGHKWCNGGEFAEIIAKSVLGFEPKKDANTSYDVDSDIPEIKASVKSSKFTLVNKKLGDTFEESVDNYFATTHSTTWIYTIVIDNIATLYIMNKVEFEQFLYTFTSLNERNVVRCKATSGKMIAWFENKI